MQNRDWSDNLLDAFEIDLSGRIRHVRWPCMAWRVNETRW